jgi:hypothetical protein
VVVLIGTKSHIIIYRFGTCVVDFSATTEDWKKKEQEEQLGRVRLILNWSAFGASKPSYEPRQHEVEQSA